jgi:predicted aspartyl protease
MKHLITPICIFCINVFFASCKQEIKVESNSTDNTSLRNFLNTKNYIQIPLVKNSIGHFIIKAKVNNDSAIFILDTGASGTCIDFESAKKFKLNLKDASGGAAGYGGDAQKIQTGNATITMSGFKRDTMQITAIDLTSVNQAYSTEKSGHIDGVIGADILIGSMAVIDYETNSLYLKK